MKKYLISSVSSTAILLLVFFPAANVMAKDTKAYRVMNDIIDAANYCAMTSDYEASENDTSVQGMTKAMTRIDYFNRAHDIVKKYTKDRDGFIRKIAGLFSIGTEMLVKSNQAQLDMIRSLANNDTRHLKDLDYNVAQLYKGIKDGWEAIGNALNISWVICLDLVDNDSAIKTSSFKITPNERQRLVNNIDRMFGVQLERYSDHRAAISRGEMGNPKDQTWLIVGMDSIRKMLSTERRIGSD